MDKFDDLVPRVQTLLKTVDEGERVFVFPDGRIEVVSASDVELPDYAGDGQDPIARFVAGHAEIPDQEVEDRIKTGLAGYGHERSRRG